MTVPIYRYLGPKAEQGTVVRFDSASGSDTPVDITNSTGTLLDYSHVVVGPSGMVPTVYGPVATVYLKRIELRPTGPDRVLEVLGPVTGTDTAYTPPSPGAGVDQAARDSVATLAASLPATYASWDGTNLKQNGVTIPISGGGSAVDHGDYVTVSF